jgi:hypothetical protein
VSADLWPLEIRFGDRGGADLAIAVTGYAHPEVAEPQGFDLLECRASAHAPPVEALFEFSVRSMEFAGLRGYLTQINSGNGPPETFTLAGGLLTLSFAPSRRGPVLCAVLLKSIDASHARLEYLITLEPEEISRALASLARLPPAV